MENFIAWVVENFIALLALLALVVSSIVAFFQIYDRKQAKFNLSNDYMNEVLAWHGEVVRVLMRLRVFENKASTEYVNDLALLSALIEQGRFFFPNVDRGDSYGLNKPFAFRGYRHLALDFLVASYNVFSKQITEKSQSEAETLQRHFTSIVFEIVRPKDRIETIRRLTNNHFYQNKSIKDFLGHEDTTAVAHMWKRAPKG